MSCWLQVLFRGSGGWTRTSRLEALLEPEQANGDNYDVDEAKVGDDGNKIDVQLLVGLEIFHVDTVGSMSTYPQTREAERAMWSFTYVLRPDSVEALAPKK